MINQKKLYKSQLASMIAAVAGVSGVFASPLVSAAEKSFALEEVVVTAQKKEESLVDVPVAVSAFSGEVLNMQKAQQFQDLVQVSPSVTFNQAGDGRGVGVNIRGMGTTAFQVAVEPTVSTVVDGVTLGRTNQFLSDLTDVERVEVLRGPQGTLFGKNASAGVINIVTKRPSEEFEGSVKLTATDDNAWGVQASVSGPLTDAIRGRATVYSREYDGFGKNLFDGKKLNAEEVHGVRAKLEFDITDSVNLLLIGDYSKQDRDCCFSPLSALAGGNGIENRFLAFDYQGVTIDEENTTVNMNTPTYSNTETSGISAEFNVDFDKFVFTSITAYRSFELDQQQDADFMPYDGPTYGRFVITSNGAIEANGGQEQDQFSQEFRITTTAWDNFDVTAGLFYWDQSLDRAFEREVYFCTTPGAGAGLSPDPAVTPCTGFLYGYGVAYQAVDTKNWALFGQANWHFTESWTASLGWRYTEDDIEFDFERVTSSPAPAVPPSFAGSNQTEEENWSGKLALQWNVTDDMMWFVSYAEGYKSPAFDVIFATNASRMAPAPEETSEAWETGIKSELFENRLRLAVTAFHTKFLNLQGQVGIFTPPNTTTFILTSAGSAITKGLEVDITVKPTPNLLINGGIGWIDATYDEFPLSNCYSGQTAAQGCTEISPGVFNQDLGGEDIPNSPDLKFSLQARYDIELDAPYDMYVNINYRWQDDVTGSQDQNPLLNRDSYDVVDLVVGLDADDGRWGAQLFVKNLLDDFYEDNLGGGSTNVTHFLARDHERYVGVEVNYRFGSL